jgi:hypothetical protein
MLPMLCRLYDFTHSEFLFAMEECVADVPLALQCLCLTLPDKHRDVPATEHSTNEHSLRRDTARRCSASGGQDTQST